MNDTLLWLNTLEETFSNYKLAGYLLQTLNPEVFNFAQYEVNLLTSKLPVTLYNHAKDKLGISLTSSPLVWYSQQVSYAYSIANMTLLPLQELLKPNVG